MTILEKVFGKDKEEETEDEPIVIVNKKYRLCVDDKPDERGYRYCGKKDTISPACTLSLNLEGLTHEEACELDLEIRNMLDRHDFQLR